MLDRVFTLNTGMTFGLFQYQYAWIAMIPVTVAVIVALLNWLARSTRLLICCAIGGILGGATGNLIDRFQYGRVIDFLHLHLGAADPFPYIFNLGDSAISLSVGVLLIDQVFFSFR